MFSLKRAARAAIVMSAAFAFADNVIGGSADGDVRCLRLDRVPGLRRLRRLTAHPAGGLSVTLQDHAECLVEIEPARELAGKGPRGEEVA